MTEINRLVGETCRTFLTAVHLKALCKHRGFNAPAGADKDSLASFVASRLLGREGVEEAIASLDELGLLLLHRIAMASEPVPFSELADVLRGRGYQTEDRALFGRLLDSLGNRGCVLIGDAEARSRHCSRYESVELSIPPGFRPAIPPFPIDSAPIGPGGAAFDPIALARRAVAEAVKRSGLPQSGHPQDTLGRLSARVKIQDGHLTVMDRQCVSAPEIAAWVRGAWFDGHVAAARKRRVYWARDALVGACHVLGAMPPGRGCRRERQGRSGRRGLQGPGASTGRRARAGQAPVAGDARLLLQGWAIAGSAA